MTDIDLMTDRQMWVMFGLAVALWAVVLRSWWVNSRPRRTRRTYRPGGVSVDITLGLKKR